MLAIRGEHSLLDAQLANDAVALLNTAGAWHASCLEDAAIGPLWQRALLWSYVETRKYAVVAETAGFTVLRTPQTRETIAISQAGNTFSLSFAGGRARTMRGGAAYSISHPFELAYDADLVALIQAALRGAGSVPVLAVATWLDVDRFFLHRDVLDLAEFRYVSELEPLWSREHVSVVIDYAVFVPDELLPFTTA